jgi:hypothetical protein
MSLSRTTALKAISFFLFWTFLFSAAYCQSPLYTSNQNQYFLHGLARAGYGSLEGDWLANTLDPTPVFSVLVEGLYRLFHLPAVFYLVYALLMGGYLFSFLGIARLLFLPPGKLPTLLFLALFIAVHSAGLRFGLARLLGPNWTFALEDGLADQRMLGLVLQPSAFGVFLAASVYLFLLRRPYLAVLSAALAAAFHPTYLLSAAFLTLAYMTSDLLVESRPTRAVGIGLLALLAVAPIVVYVFNSFSGSGVTPDLAAEARRLLVHVRIPHHALASWWFDATAAFKLVLILAAIVLARRTPLFLPLLVPFLAGLILSLAQLLLKSDLLALLFPWRVSVLLVPLSSTVLLAQLTRLLSERTARWDSQAQRLLKAGAVVIIALACLAGLARFGLDLQRKSAAPERALENFVYTHPAPGEVFLAPVKMQDFRLAAGAQQYIDFKSIPYEAADVLEWDRRYRLADSFFHTPDCPALRQLAAEEGVSRLVLPTDQALECSFLLPLYTDPHYRLFAIEQ